MLIVDVISDLRDLSAALPVAASRVSSIFLYTHRKRS